MICRSSSAAVADSKLELLSAQGQLSAMSSTVPERQVQGSGAIGLNVRYILIIKQFMF